MVFKFKGTFLDSVFRKIDKNIQKALGFKDDNPNPSNEVTPPKTTTYQEPVVILHRDNIPKKVIINNTSSVNNKVKIYCFNKLKEDRFKEDKVKEIKKVTNKLSPLLSLFPEDEDIYVIVKLTSDGQILDTSPYILKQSDGTVLTGEMLELLDGILN